MPNNAYLRSVRRERELVNQLRSTGWTACRSAGSKSPWDVWAFHPELKLFRVYQIKTKKGGKGKYEKVVFRDGFDATGLWLEFK